VIKIIHGDLLNAKVDALVNAVNCVGIMGKGIALQFKQSFYYNFLQYKKSCMKNEVHIGEMFTYEIQGSILPKYIINFPTKQHWKDNSLIESIDSGLISLGKEIDRLDICSIAIPLIGSGLGSLDPDLILDRIKSFADNHMIKTITSGKRDVDFLIYVSKGKTC